MRTNIEFNIFGVLCPYLIFNTVQSRFNKSRLFEFSFRPSRFAAVKVISDEYRIYMKLVSLHAHVSLVSIIPTIPSNRLL